MKVAGSSYPFLTSRQGWAVSFPGLNHVTLLLRCVTAQITTVMTTLKKIDFFLRKRSNFKRGDAACWCVVTEFVYSG